jgi:hypothetical protein
MDEEARAWVLTSLLSGALMAAVAVGAVLLCRRTAPTPWRWFWAGAAVWTAGVALKFAVAAVCYQPLLDAMEARLPHRVYVALGSLWTGLLTGVFEGGATLAAALIWRRWADEPRRALAIGVGAGSIEALLLAIVTALGSLAVLDPSAMEALSSARATPMLALVAPTERVIAILLHASSRVLILRSVAAGRARWFAYGFLLQVAIDAIAGYLHVSGEVTRMSPWAMEAMLAPLGLVSVPVLILGLRGWPVVPRSSGYSTSTA